MLFCKVHRAHNQSGPILTRAPYGVFVYTDIFKITTIDSFEKMGVILRSSWNLLGAIWQLDFGSMAI